MAGLLDEAVFPRVECGTETIPAPARIATPIRLSLVNTPPLVEAEVDLSDFAYMPLDVARLLTSDTWIEAADDPRVGFALVSLWCASWHQRPAASIPNNDRVLARLAMVRPEVWTEIRDRVLAGWTLCSDGRFYHRVVAEKAQEAWKAKRDRLRRVTAATSAAAEKKLAQRRAVEARAQKRVEKRLQKQRDPATVRDGTVTDAGMHPKRSVSDGIERERERESKEEKPKATRAARPGSEKLVLTNPTPPLLDLSALLPDWLPQADWQAFLDHRKRLKKPISVEAYPKVIAKLDELRKAGHDPVRVIDNSIVNGWAGLFALKLEMGGGAGSGGAAGSDPTRGYR
jgi:hypothetical protein